MVFVSGFYVSSDSLTNMGADSLYTCTSSVVISSGVYDEQKKSFFMIDNDGKIWEYNLTTVANGLHARYWIIV